MPKTTAPKYSQVAQKQGQLPPKNLNVLAKSKKPPREGQGLDQKLMIDKKTYEDLMSYLVKAEVNRLKTNKEATKR